MKTAGDDTAKPGDPCVVVFDGTCNLCNGSVRFIIKHDPAGRFTFASAQSSAGAALAAACGLSGPTPGSMVLVAGGKCFVRSTGALEIARRLNGWWPLLYVFILVPRPIRDAVYKWIGKRRHRLFGSSDQCVNLPPDRTVGDVTATASASIPSPAPAHRLR